MPVETDAERAIFVDPADFGSELTWTRGGVVSGPFGGIFDAPYQMVLGDGEDPGMEAAAPQVLVRASDLPEGAGQDDVVTILERDYLVAGLQPDGTGMVTVRLQEA